MIQVSVKVIEKLNIEWTSTIVQDTDVSRTSNLCFPADLFKYHKSPEISFLLV